MSRKLKVLVSVPLVAGVFVIIYFSLGAVYYKKQREGAELNSRIQTMSASLSKPGPDIELLKKQLAEAEAEGQAVLGSLPGLGQGIDIYGELVELGRKGNVDIVSISASSAMIPRGGTGGETILPYSISLKGSQDDILSFISSLVQGEQLLKGVELQGTNIRISPLPGGDEAVNLELYVHTWPNVIPAGQDAGLVAGGNK